MGWGTGNIGGGSGGLNFKVVGNPQPASPKENTIWVNTDVKIPNWYFSATQPENMTEGDVWFPTDAESALAFNALKKNTVMVYPLSAKQMITGALVDKSAKSYQSGEWVDWITDIYLIKSGTDCTDVTGGWESVGAAISSNYTAKAPSISFTGGNLVISQSSQKTSGICKIKNTIKLKGGSGICRLKANATGDATNSNAMLYVAPVGTSYFNGNSVKIPIGGSHDFIELDLSECVSGEYTVYIGVWNYTTSSTKVYASELYFEGV